MKKSHLLYTFVIGLMTGVAIAYAAHVISEGRRDRPWKQLMGVFDDKYLQLKGDPDKLSEYRSELRLRSIQDCNNLKAMLPLRDQEAIAIERGIEAIESGVIEDGLPRLISAYIDGDTNLLFVRWLESDFDTVSLVIWFDGEVIEQRVFENHNLEKWFLFNYYRVYCAPVAPLASLLPDENLSAGIIVKYVEPNSPRLGPVLLPTDIDPIYVPDGKFEISIRDKAGNESERMQVLILNDLRTD